jgi:hypothetical protein
MPDMRGHLAINSAAAQLAKYTADVEKAAAENEQDEEIESMLAAAEIEDREPHDGSSDTAGQGDHKRTKLKVCEDSLKSASAQIVVTNTLTEYARSALQILATSNLFECLLQILETIHRVLLHYRLCVITCSRG